MGTSDMKELMKLMVTLTSQVRDQDSQGSGFLTSTRKVVE